MAASILSTFFACASLAEVFLTLDANTTRVAITLVFLQVMMPILERLVLTSAAQLAGVCVFVCLCVPTVEHIDGEFSVKIVQIFLVDLPFHSERDSVWTCFTLSIIASCSPPDLPTTSPLFLSRCRGQWIRCMLTPPDQSTGAGK